MERCAIVIGGDHHNTLGVIRSLGRKGVNPYVILTNKSRGDILKTQYLKGYKTVNNCDEAIELLLNDFVNYENKPVLFACHDKISSCLDINRDRLETYFVIPGTELPGRVTHYMNKQTMAALAKHCGLSIPDGIILNNISYEKNKAVIQYPCITKPVESRQGSKSDIHVFQLDSQLHCFLESKIGNDYIVQRFIEKDFEFQFIGCSIDSGKTIIIPGVSVILRQPANTNTGFLHYRQLDSSFKETVEKSKLFIQTIGYSGLFSVEFLRDKEGVDYFMEINFRNDGNAISVTNSGVNLPYIWYLFSCGFDFSEEIKPIHEEYVMPEFDELNLYSTGRISFTDLYNDMRKATSFMDYDKDDPKPTRGWINYSIRATKVLAKKILHR